MNRSITASLLVLGVLAQAGCAVTSGRSSAGQYVDDTAITARVKSRFADDPQVAATRIGVETFKGTVQLSGYAVSEAERLRAVQLARSVPDVRDVRNDVLVRPPTQ
jgi:osmotically-inducible protein OsmY